MAVFLLSTIIVNGRQNPATAVTTIKPERDPNQPIHEEYTRKIREYTTAPVFTHSSSLTSPRPPRCPLQK